MKDKALPVFERNNVKRGKNKEAKSKLHSSTESLQDTVEKKWGELW